MVRVIVYGAGAVGCVIGVRLFQSEHDVTLIARGDNYLTLESSGATLESPDGVVNVKVPVVNDPSLVTFEPSDVVILAMKSQGTQNALRQLDDKCHPETTIVCAQNGVENERLALRHFENVYGMYVMCQAVHLTPGVVKIASAPVSAILDVGRWPIGADDFSLNFAEILNASSFDSVARSDIERWKWGKLLRNLGNVVEAICGSATRGGELIRRAVQEGTDVLDAAGIDYATLDENLARREGILDIVGHEFGGGSSWQSLTRRTGDIETDYLTGEIVLQGRLNHVPTPVNQLLQRLANRMASERLAPGAWSESDILRML